MDRVQFYKCTHRQTVYYFKKGWLILVNIILMAVLYSISTNFFVWRMNSFWTFLHFFALQKHCLAAVNEEVEEWFCSKSESPFWAIPASLDFFSEIWNEALLSSLSFELKTKNYVDCVKQILGWFRCTSLLEIRYCKFC